MISFKMSTIFITHVRNCVTGASVCATMNNDRSDPGDIRIWCVFFRVSFLVQKIPNRSVIEPRGGKTHLLGSRDQIKTQTGLLNNRD